MQDSEQPNQCSTHIDDGLNNVGPDDGRETAFKGVYDRERSDDGDGSDFTRTQRDGHDDRDGIYADALGSRASHQEKPCGKRTQLASEAAFDQFIGGIKVSTEIVRQQNEADDDASG